jgi:hypothetical protein
MLEKTDDGAPVDKVFTDSRFHRIGSAVYGWVGKIDGERIGVVVATKSQRFANSTDYLLNKDDFDRLVAALNAGRLDEAWVVCAKIDQSGKLTFISAIETKFFFDTLANMPRRSGRLGDFYLVNEEFTTEEEDF